MARSPDTPTRDDRLTAYREKRTASRTPEPFGGRVVAGGSIFVVQKHAARNLHWDLRLELDGVLLSWAVPKGPSPNQADKRLAMQTEDHPLEYAEFEGVIPEGEYGAGAMIVWDRGVWVPIEDAHEGLEKGKLLFELRGHKLMGRWTLVKTKQAPNSWLWIKERDAYLDDDKTTEDYPDDSIYSGLTVDEFPQADVHAEELGRWVEELGARRKALRADDVSLMLASSEEEPFTREGWIFELKYDGYRLLAERSGREASLRSRRGHDLTATFPEIARAVRGLPYEGLIVDGEVVVNDVEGKPSFSRLQKRGRILNKDDALRSSVESPAVLHAFDVLAVEGYDLRALAAAPAQGDPSRAPALRGADPLRGPYPGTRGGDVRPGGADAVGRDRREAGRRALSRRPLQELDQDSDRACGRLRRGGLDGAEGLTGRVRLAPHRTVRRGYARLPRRGRVRIPGQRARGDPCHSWRVSRSMRVPVPTGRSPRARATTGCARRSSSR